MLLKGHTFNMCDLFFGLIERKTVNTENVTQADYARRTIVDVQLLT
jgi:hypothetical protein